MKLRLYRTAFRVAGLEYWDSRSGSGKAELVVKRYEDTELDDEMYVLITDLLDICDGVFDGGFYVYGSCVEEVLKDEEERELWCKIYGKRMVNEAVRLLKKWEEEGWKYAVERDKEQEDSCEKSEEKENES